MMDNFLVSSSHTGAATFVWRFHPAQSSGLWVEFSVVVFSVVCHMLTFMCQASMQWMVMFLPPSCSWFMNLLVVSLPWQSLFHWSSVAAEQ